MDGRGLGDYANGLGAGESRCDPGGVAPSFIDSTCCTQRRASPLARRLGVGPVWSVDGVGEVEGFRDNAGAGVEQLGEACTDGCSY
jgi:hypothetical protein